MNPYHESTEKRVLLKGSTTFQRLNKIETKAGMMGKGVESGEIQDCRECFS